MRETWDDVLLFATSIVVMLALAVVVLLLAILLTQEDNWKRSAKQLQATIDAPVSTQDMR